MNNNFDNNENNNSKGFNIDFGKNDNQNENDQYGNQSYNNNNQYENQNFDNQNNNQYVNQNYNNQNDNQYYNNQKYGSGFNNTGSEDPGREFAIASLIFGVAGVILMVFFGIGLIPSVIGLIFGVMSGNKSAEAGLPRNNMAVAGLVCSGVSIGVSILVLISCFACGGCAICASML